MAKLVILFPSLAPAIAACAQLERPGTALEIQRDTVGDTIFVHTVSGSIWEGEARLEEELRIGVLDGVDEYVFGDVVEITPDAAGGVYVFDRQVPALRQYDQEGRFIRTLGGPGAGPGEYGNAILGMALRRDGRLMAHDAQNARINLYEPDGTASEHWQISSGLFVDQSLLVDSLDHTYVKILVEEPRWPMRWPWPIGLLHLDERGQVVDTIPAPSIEGERESSGGPLNPTKVWAIHPYGTVVGVNDTYSFEIRKPSGKVVRISRQYDPLPVTDEEWRAYEARRAWEIERDEPSGSEPPPRTPRTKPAYRSFHIGQDGRIWVRKYMPVTYEEVNTRTHPDEPPPLPFTEPVGFDVFAPDGAYLGEIILPPKSALKWIGADRMDAVQRGEHDEQYVVRLRLIHPG